MFRLHLHLNLGYTDRILPSYRNHSTELTGFYIMTTIFSVNLHILSWSKKISTRKTNNFGHFYGGNLLKDHSHYFVIQNNISKLGNHSHWRSFNENRFRFRYYDRNYQVFHDSYSIEHSANIYLFRATIETLEKGVKYVKS